MAAGYCIGQILDTYNKGEIFQRESDSKCMKIRIVVILWWKALPAHTAWLHIQCLLLVLQNGRWPLFTALWEWVYDNVMFGGIAEVYWQGSGPLFFYTGNEGPIEQFYANTGFLFTLAQQFKAMIVFAEHVSSLD